MEFLHVGLLTWFLPIVGIPLVLHLLTLHRLKTVELSTFRFLFDSYVQQRRKMKFLDALIAVLRTLFLLFLLLAIARPTVRHWAGLFGSGTGRDIVFMVDCSASMETVTDGISAIDRAKQVAATVLSQMSGDDRVTVVRVASRPQILSSRFTADSDSLQEQIAGLKTSPARGNLFAAFQQLFSPGADPLIHPQIYLFTDVQASGWKEIQEQPIKNLLPDQTKLMLVNVGSQNTTTVNLAVVGHAPSPHRAIVGLPVTLRPRVANYSKSSAEEVTISILIDEEEIARKRVNVPAGETVNADILFTPHQDGVLKGRYQIEGDHFPVDDTYLFTLVVEPKVKVLLINGVPSADPLLNEGLYLRTAMTTVHPFTPETPEDEKPADPPCNQCPTFRLVLPAAYPDLPQDPEDALEGEQSHKREAEDRNRKKQT